jgi:ribosomal protein L37AE/L43A
MDHQENTPGTLTCPFCSEAELRPFGRNSLRCNECGGVLGGALLETLYRIVALPDAAGSHACECGHPEMRRLPDDVYRCPACGSEVTPVSVTPVSWKSPDHTEAYWCGWLDGRYGDPQWFTTNHRLAKWEGSDRLDYYRGHRAGHDARLRKVGLVKAS